MAKARRGTPAWSVRTLVTPNEHYSDVHDDHGPYTDNGHEDEHGDFHDQHTDDSSSERDPMVAVSQAIDRLSRMMARFEASHRARLEKNSADTLSKVEKLEARLSAIEKSLKNR